ncbi:hypothetical protein AKJ09_04633 [Labilithrix luteola]|uniref:Lipoprotein n=1 Tax=Labilithrix luteola TaxID=1391654 RepID=A0A0K1PXU5_9BACT|nr:hypothetical protein [Labilithrix luteola]AKU97969.1 hypothetical protein AKJ09_04633 [Labilithrix luteola]
MKTTSARSLVVFAFALALGACGPSYDHTEITGVVASPLGGTVTFQRVEIPEGMIVKAHIVSLNDDDDLMGGTVRSHDESIVGVSSLVSDRDFAFEGRKPGRTDVEILADGKLVLVLEAIVSAQP